MGKKKNIKKTDIDTQEETIKEAKTFEIKAEAEILFKPQEWAMNQGLNPTLFEAWKNDKPINKEGFERIKKQVM